MAQSVERVLGKDEVGGSNPPSSSKNEANHMRLASFLLDSIGVFQGKSRFLGEWASLIELLKKF